MSTPQHDDPQGIPEQGSAPPPETIAHERLTEKPGTMIGPYKLLEQIGEGGMGVVYMSEQLRPVRRKVALKIIKPGMDSRQVIARFEAERQALALMDHPNIAHVLDAGSTESGRPFFVMELVRGIPITEYCDQNKLLTRQRLELFVSVCQAVQHAHTKGIIHRDLKPTNVLVTLHDGVPVPKIIDFGVAKATNQQLTERTLFTSFAQMVGTPLYMSPEQAEMSGLDVDTRSDIYSLGVLLYELLTGTTPFDRHRIGSAAYDEVRRIIREEEPARPSTRISSLGDTQRSISAQRGTDPRRLSQSLRGELDWIVMKTLEKDRTRRYETASALAADVTRYLNGETVEACPPSAAYRVRKFARRHKAQVSVALGFVLLLLASSAMAWILYADARGARNDALAAQAESVVERDRALAAQQTADENRQRAEKEKQRAESERARADRHAEELKQRLYDYNLIKAAAAHRENDTGRVIELLEDCLEDQRRWEWYRLRRLADAERKLELPVEQINHFAVSPDGSRIAVADTAGTLRLYDSGGGEAWSQSLPSEVPFWIAFSPNGELIAVTTMHGRLQDLGEKKVSGSLQLWAVESGRRLFSAASPEGLFFFVAFSADGQYLAASGGDPAGGLPFVQLLSVKTNQEVWRVGCPGVATFSFAPDGRHLYLSSMGGPNPNQPSTLACWRVQDHAEVWSVQRRNSSFVTLNHDGTQLVTGGINHSLQIWDAGSGEKLQELQGPHADIVLWCTISHDGKHLVSCGHSGHIVLWDWQSKQVLKSVQSRGGGMPQMVTFTADGRHFVSAASTPGNQLQFWEVEPLPSVLVLAGHENVVKGVAFHKTGNRILSVSTDGTLRDWDAETGQELRTLPVESAYCVACGPHGKYIATGGSAGAKLWNADTGELVHHWSDLGAVWWIRFTPDGQQVTAAGTRRVVKLWNVADGQQQLSLETPSNVDGIGVAPDGGQAVLLMQTLSQLLVWDLETGSSQELRPSLEPIHARCVVFHPQGRIVATGLGRTVELWDVQSKQLLMTLEGHREDVYALAFDEPGLRLFSGDKDGTIKVWNVETGEQLLSIAAHEGFVQSLALSPDGKTLASAGDDGMVKLWETTRPSSEVVARRHVVREASRLVNERYRQSPMMRDVLEALTRDPSLERQVLAVAVDIANARGDRPRGPLTEAATAESSQETMARIQEHLHESRRSLFAHIESAAGADLDAADQSSLQTVGAGQWHSAAIRLAAAGETGLSNRELIALLTPLVESYPRVHQFAYVRALAHAQRGRWAEADRDLSTALERAPEKTALWHEYAYRLAYLLAYTGQRERYGALCQKTLADFAQIDDARLAERTAKMCLFSADIHVDIEEAAQLADRSSAAQDVPRGLPRYIAMAQGIADYRRANYAAAVDVLRSADDAFRSGNAKDRVATKLYLAMALQQTGQHDEARQTLQDAVDIMDSELPRPDADDFPGWNDWMIGQIVRPEAEALIGR